VNIKAPNIKKLYYSIGEVSKITKLKSYVLRYWETEFKQLRPPKNRAGNRTYRQKDIDLIQHIKDLLYNRKFTIEGARNQLQQVAVDGLKVMDKKAETVVAAGKDQLSISTPLDKEILKEIKQQLQSLLEIIGKK
jgi:DNA-binding transcriptional MerR regulator